MVVADLLLVLFLLVAVLVVMIAVLLVFIVIAMPVVVVRQVRVWRVQRHGHGEGDVLVDALVRLQGRHLVGDRVDDAVVLLLRVMVLVLRLIVVVVQLLLIVVTSVLLLLVMLLQLLLLQLLLLQLLLLQLLLLLLLLLWLMCGRRRRRDRRFLLLSLVLRELRMCGRLVSELPLLVHAHEETLRGRRVEVLPAGVHRLGFIVVAVAAAARARALLLAESFLATAAAGGARAQQAAARARPLDRTAIQRLARRQLAVKFNQAPTAVFLAT